MRVYDPTDERRDLDSDFGYGWLLRKPFTGSEDIQELAGYASFDLNTAVQCILVGYDEPATALLTRTFDALSRRIGDGSCPPEPPPGERDHDLYFFLALCTWLLFGTQAADLYAVFVRKYDAFLLETKLAKNKTEVGLTLPQYVDARAYREALALFNNARMTPPASLTRVRSEGQMSYVLCRHHLGEQYDAGEVRQTARRVLKSNVSLWLTNGHYLRVAEWMKIVHWSGEASAASARQAVRACYDYLAVPRPPGIN